LRGRLRRLWGFRGRLFEIAGGWLDREKLLMPTFDFRFLVEASLPAVREFHHDTRALKRLTPPPTLVQLHEVEPLGEGSVSRFTLWVGPLPLRWRAVHRDVSQTGFTDIQAEGPARRWEHTHRFTAITPQLTEIHEHIEFEHKSGFWGVVTRMLFAYPNLWLMFTWRKFVTRFFLRRSAATVGHPAGGEATMQPLPAPVPAAKR
jgi:ligand-binding SRPBCC domain-containing protein